MADVSRPMPRGIAAAMVIASAALSFLLAAAIARLILDPQNRLENNDRWLLTKLEMRRDLAGAYAYSARTEALAGNHLDLSLWNGFNEIVLKEAINATRFQFRFRLSPDSYLYVTPYQTEALPRAFEEYGMIRFSTHPAFPTGLLTTDRSGVFHSNHAMQDVSLVPDRWHKCTLEVLPDFINIYMDGVKWGAVPFPREEGRHLAFRGSFNRVLIDDIEIWTDDGRQIVESFDQYGRFGAIALTTALTAVVLLLAAVFIRRRSATNRAAAAYCVSALICAAMTAWTAVVLEQRWLSRYPSPSAQWVIIGKLEFENRVIESRKRELERYTATLPESRDHRILFLGSSQTWGAGAWNDREGVVRQTDRMLQEQRPDQVIQCINGGVSGLDSSALRELYENDYLEFGADVVVVNLSWNDRKLDVFSDNLREIIRFNQQRGITTLLVQEAYTEEIVSPALAEKHGAIAALGKEMAVPVLNAHNHMRAARDKGILWWDYVHPTAFGHYELAKAFSRFILENLPAGEAPPAQNP